MTEDVDAGDWKLRAETAEAALYRFQTEAESRLIRAELKAEAIRSGMVDLDGLKLIEASDIKLTDTGEVSDVTSIFSKLKRAKPWLFGGLGSSSASVSAPVPEPARTRHANELSHEEWVSARAKLMRRR